LSRKGAFLNPSKYYRKLALVQWDIFVGVALIALVALAWQAVMPFGQDVYSNVNNVCKNAALLGKADSLALLPEIARMKADKIDSCIKTISVVQMVSEQDVPGAIYGLANQSGIKASKVEISGKTKTDQGVRIPVSFRGEGDYAACGKFIDGIEHMQTACRVLELNMKAAGGGSIGLFVNFVLMAQQ
jgi:hypothetical protein